MPDGKCTGWFDGYWLDCCLQHDCDCGRVYPLPCLLHDNYDLMSCVIASSFSAKVNFPVLVRANARLMFVGVTVLNPILVRFERVKWRM